MDTRNEKSIQLEVIPSKTFNRLYGTFGWYAENTSPGKTSELPHLHIPVCIGFKESSPFVAHFDLVVDALLLEQKNRSNSAGVQPFTFTIYLYCNPNDFVAVDEWKKKYSRTIEAAESHVIDIRKWRKDNIAVRALAEEKWQGVWGQIASPTASKDIKTFGAKLNTSLDKDVVRYLGSLSGLSENDKNIKIDGAKKALINEIIDGLAWCSDKRVNILLHEGKIPDVLKVFTQSLPIFGYVHQRDLIYQDFALKKDLEVILTTKTSTAPIPVPQAKDPVSLSVSPPISPPSSGSPRVSRERYLIDSVLSYLDGSLQNAALIERAEVLGAFVKAASNDGGSRSSSRSNSPPQGSPTSELVDRGDKQVSPSSSSSDDFSGESVNRIIDQGSSTSSASSASSSASSSPTPEDIKRNRMGALPATAPASYSRPGVRESTLFGNAVANTPVSSVVSSKSSERPRQLAKSVS